MSNARLAFVLAVAFVATAPVAFSQSAAQKKTAAPTSIGQVLDRQFTNLEREFVPAADAMPEDKYNFAPSKNDFNGLQPAYDGVRTFAQQVKHVAATNYLIFAALLGEKPPVDLGGENGPDSMTSKSDIMKFLRDSFTYGHRALPKVNSQNALQRVDSPFGKATRLGLGTEVVPHAFDHYGQMVEYLRMNGIIPPASRKQ